MGLLSSNNSGNETEEEEQYQVKKTETKEKRYTEHEAVIKYPDGSTEEVTFDSMEHRDDFIILKNYTGVSNGRYRRFDSEAFMTLPYENFRNFETVNREDAYLEYDVTEKVMVAKSELEDFLDEHDNAEVV